MSQDLNPYATDRMLTIQDERDRIIVFKDFQLVPPNVGIFDEPTRCYKINKEWAKIMTGAVSILLEIGVWKYAEHEGYNAIQQISDFLDGLECPPDMIVEDIRVNGCNIEALIDGVWVNKGSVLSCVTGITNPMQTQINTNINNISNNQTAITTNANKNTEQDGRLDSLELDIQTSINPSLQDHETRITALENIPPVGGSGTQYKISTYQIYIASNDSITGETYQDMQSSSYAHIFTYPNALIVYEFRVNNTGSNAIASYRFTFDSVAGVHEAYAQGVNIQSLQLNEIVSGMSGAVLIKLQARRTTVSSANTVLLGEQNIQAFVIEWDDEPEPEPEPLIDPLITFDDGGAPYALSADNTVGVISATGNPNNCASCAGFPLDSDKIAFEVDLGAAKQIDNVEYDFYTDDTGELIAWLYVDGVPINGNAHSDQLANNTWHRDTAGFLAGLPVTGQVVEIRVGRTIINTITDARIDNILIDTGGV